MPAVAKCPKFSVAASLLTFLVLGEGTSADAYDLDNGKAIARRWCASCHLVTPDQQQASADVPSFASIAARPDFNADGTARFLMDPHPKMPNFALGRQETEDIAQYIASLAGKERKPNSKPTTRDFTL